MIEFQKMVSMTTVFKSPGYLTAATSLTAKAEIKETTNSRAH